MHREHVWAERDDGNRAQVVGRDTLVPGGGLVDRERGGRGEDSVAVGRRAAHRLCREIAAGSAAIFHHYRVSKPLAELLSDQPGDDVGNAAGGESNLERDGLRRKGLRRNRLREADGARHEQQAAHGAESRQRLWYHPCLPPGSVRLHDRLKPRPGFGALPPHQIKVVGVFPLDDEVIKTRPRFAAAVPVRDMISLTDHTEDVEMFEAREVGGKGDIRQGVRRRRAIGAQRGLLPSRRGGESCVGLQ